MAGLDETFDELTADAAQQQSCEEIALQFALGDEIEIVIERFPNVAWVKRSETRVLSARAKPPGFRCAQPRLHLFGIAKSESAQGDGGAGFDPADVLR
ncbi:MAG: hypothetical protein ACYDC8_15425 [Gammaproteobacteria bacterium]